MSETPDRPRTTTIVVMGVSGAGKSSVAAELVGRLGWDFAEGDDLHPPENVAKMRAGTALTDEERRPWLARLGGWIDARVAAGTNAVVTCSALRRAYRDTLRKGRPSVWFAHVVADPELIRDRMERRTGHYMPASLLDSQLDTLEPLQPDEPGTVVSATAPPAEVAGEVLAALREQRGLALPSEEAS